MSDAGPLRWQRAEHGLVQAVTHRHGGASTGEFAGLNLGLHVGDDAAVVRANRAALSDCVGLPVAYMDQVHGREVVHVTHADDLPSCDAMVTTTPGLALAALVADCTPVLLADREAGVVGVAHAGRPGMVAGVVPAAVAAMTDLGARRIDAVVGPSVCARCYEVPAPMRAEASASNPASHAVSWDGTAAIDVAGGVVAQLAELAPVVDITWLPGCTFEDESLYSYRRDGRTGRFAGVVGLVP